MIRSCRTPVLRAATFVACGVLVTFAGCGEKPPSEDDAKMAVQSYLVSGAGLPAGRALADRTCSSAFTSDSDCRVGPSEDVTEWAGNVQEMTRVVEVGSPKKGTVLTQRTNRFGAPFYDTHDITVWPVKVELLLECICRDRAGPVEGVNPRPFTTTQEYRLRYLDSKPHWWVHDS